MEHADLGEKAARSGHPESARDQADPFTAADFIQANSSGYLAAAKFVNGPGDDSGFGAVVPEPGTAVLLGAGLLVVAARQRTRREG